MKKIIALALAFAIFGISLPALSLSPSKMDREIQCMAANIYWEAKNESEEGKMAVAQVTINRANSSHYPDSICQVVHQKYKNVCQFSWVCHHPHDKINEELWQECLEISHKALLWGETHGKLHRTDALYYHASYVKPYWAKSKVRLTKIGNHIFYADKIMVASR